MAPGSNGRKRKLGKQQQQHGESSSSNRKSPKVTLDEIEGISSDDDDEKRARPPTKKKQLASKGRRGIEMGGDNDEEEQEGELEARALRQAIMEGAFDKLSDGEDDDSNNDLNDDQEEKEEEEHDDEEEEDENEEEEESPTTIANTIAMSNKALLVKAEELSRSHNWVETFDVISKNPLPFHDKYTKLDVHDDLKREVAFYNMALEAVQEAKVRCKEAKAPFTRPEDFFAEMIKTDDHMAKVKDRLIFETKKISAFEQRKSNTEHKLRSKEVRQHKTSEKNKRKKQHMEEVGEWAKAAAQNRGSARDDNEDGKFLSRMSSNKPAALVKGAKRVAMDKKYGHGGKTGKFKSMDKKTINDMSEFNPRGNFSSGGMKKKSTMKKKGGAERPGKNKRMAAKQNIKRK